MKKLIVANFKLNPETLKGAVALAKVIEKGAKKSPHDVTICPPFPYISHVGAALRKVALGAQDVFWADSGAFTGEVSPSQLRTLKVKQVIVGHSERRRLLEESDSMIQKKVSAALLNNLTVILCVGEPQEVRARGMSPAKDFVRTELQKDLEGVKGMKGLEKNLVIAYEPIWAIGSGKADAPEETLLMVAHIRETIEKITGIKAEKLRVLYGGSVTSVNAGQFLQYKEISGALVGGASLRPKDFNKIINFGQKNNT